MVKSKRILCAGLSISALVMLVVYIVSVIVNSPCVHTITARHDLLNAAILALPFIELLVFALIGHKLTYINKRWLVWSIFATYFAFIIVFDFMGRGMTAPIFLNGALNRWEIVMTIVTGVRVFLLFVIPFANRWFVKAYSIGMIAFLSISFVYLLVSAHWLGEMFFSYAVAIFADMQFHAALFFFADMKTKENGWFSNVKFSGGLFDRTNKNSVEAEENERVDRPLSRDYKLICIYAASKEFNDFVQTDLFFRRLTDGVFWDENGTYYSAEQYIHHIKTLRRLADDLNEQWGNYIHRGFVDMLNLLLVDEDAYTFKADVTAVAHLLLNQPASSWAAVIDTHEKYMAEFLGNQGG